MTIKSGRVKQQIISSLLHQNGSTDMFALQHAACLARPLARNPANREEQLRMFRTVEAAASQSAQRTSETVQQRMEGPDARRNAFDSIRLFAATSVIFSHAFMVAQGTNGAEPIFWASNGQTTLGGISVAVFFVISGLFISASFERSKSTADFALKRALRIMPALCAICMISVFFIGPMVTTLPLVSYFSSFETWGYFRNALFLPNGYHLPGVFAQHPEPAVNGSIWTLKFEVICYAGAAILLSLGRFKKEIILFSWAISFMISAMWSENIPGGIGYYFVMTATMFRYFGAGMVIYLYREKIPLNSGVALALFGAAAVSIATPYFMAGVALFAAYPIIVFGYNAPAWFRNLTARGDISYGVYIYGWPIQQLVWPIGQGTPHHWLINCMIAVPLALLCGTLSWKLIEKPALGAKKNLKFGRRPVSAV